MSHLSRIAICLASALPLAFPAHAQDFKGPSSSQTPYLVSAAPGVKLVSLLTVGDAVRNARDGGAYRMVGIPDGLGAFRDGRKLVVVMNHELGATAGVARSHGGKGAFVSRWTLDIDSLAVLTGEDQIRTVKLWDAVSGSFQPGTTSFNRFCSADLAPQSAFYNKKSGRGYAGRIFLNGEEAGSEGRAFAHIVSGRDDGASYELPSMGKFSWENALANPLRQDRTVVIGTDDSTPGQVYVYVGDKARTGNPVERAGLHGGKVYGIKVAGLADEQRATPIALSTFSLVELGDARAMTGAALDALSVTGGVTRFLRPEDGAWDTLDSNVFYINTTDRYDQVKDAVGTQVGASRIHRLHFTDIRRPELGGTIETVGGDSGPQQMLDNVAVNAEGKLIVQEDVGGNAHNGKVWQFDPVTRAFTLIARHDTARFGDIGIAATAPYTNDEESSGVIEITTLVKGARWFDKKYRYYLLDVQAHYPLEAELVEGGQLLLMAVPGASKPSKDDDSHGDRDDDDDDEGDDHDRSDD